MPARLTMKSCQRKLYFQTSKKNKICTEWSYLKCSLKGSLVHPQVLWSAPTSRNSDSWPGEWHCMCPIFFTRLLTLPIVYKTMDHGLYYQPESCPGAHRPGSKATHRTNTTTKQPRQEGLKRTKHLLRKESIILCTVRQLTTCPSWSKGSSSACWKGPSGGGTGGAASCPSSSMNPVKSRLTNSKAILKTQRRSKNNKKNISKGMFQLPNMRFFTNSPELHVGHVKSAATLKKIRFSGKILSHVTAALLAYYLQHAHTLGSPGSTGGKRSAAQRQPSWCR